MSDQASKSTRLFGEAEQSQQYSQSEFAADAANNSHYSRGSAREFGGAEQSQQYSRGSTREFEELYQDQLRFVWNVLRKLGCGYDVLEDMSHEVFATAMKAWSSFDATRAVRPWLYGIAFRVLSENRRRERESLGLAPEHGGALVDETPSALDIITAHETSDAVLRALATLSLEHRTVLLMHDQEGIAAADIADELNLRVNTVYSRIRVGRENFRKHYQRAQLLETSP